MFLCYAYLLSGKGYELKMMALIVFSFTDVTIMMVLCAYSNLESCKHLGENNSSPLALQIHLVGSERRRSGGVSGISTRYIAGKSWERSIFS